MKTIQLVPSEINGKFGHLGGVGEINAGAFKPGNLPINRKGKIKMKINDEVFGELEYDYVWSRDTTIEFCGKEADIALMIDGEEDGEFSENSMLRIIL